MSPFARSLSRRRSKAQFALEFTLARSMVDNPILSNLLTAGLSRETGAME